MDPTPSTQNPLSLDSISVSNVEIPSLEVLCAQYIGRHIHLLASPYFENLLLPLELVELIQKNLSYGLSKVSPECFLQVIANGFGDIVDTPEIDEKYWKTMLLKENSLPVKMIYPEMKKDIEEKIETMRFSIKRIEQVINRASQHPHYQNNNNNNNNDDDNKSNSKAQKYDKNKASVKINETNYNIVSLSSSKKPPVSKYEELQILLNNVDGLKYNYGQIIGSKLLFETKIAFFLKEEILEKENLLYQFFRSQYDKDQIKVLLQKVKELRSKWKSYIKEELEITTRIQNEKKLEQEDQRLVVVSPGDKEETVLVNDKEIKSCLQDIEINVPTRWEIISTTNEMTKWREMYEYHLYYSEMKRLEKEKAQIEAAKKYKPSNKNIVPLRTSHSNIQTRKPYTTSMKGYHKSFSNAKESKRKYNSINQKTIFSQKSFELLKKRIAKVGRKR